MHEDRFEFNRGAIRPLDCLRDGWRLIRNEYWFFLGIALVAFMIAEFGPLGILTGPAMCGMHICLLRHANGQRISFDMLFQGFNYFGPGLVAALCMMAPILMLVAVYYVLTIAGAFGAVALIRPQQGGAPDATPLWLLLLWIGVLTFFLMAAVAVVQAIFLFAFPLIVDRELSGWEAVKTSFRAFFGNLGGALTIVFLEMVLGLVGLSLCGLGAIFILPITFAMTAMAYRQVFPLLDSYENYPLEPEPPAPIVVSKDTNVQSLEPRSTSVQGGHSPEE